MHSMVPAIDGKLYVADASLNVDGRLRTSTSEVISGSAAASEHAGMCIVATPPFVEVQQASMPIVVDIRESDIITTVVASLISSTTSEIMCTDLVDLIIDLMDLILHIYQ